MDEGLVEKVLKGVRHISCRKQGDGCSIDCGGEWREIPCRKKGKGYSIGLDQREVSMPGVTNFEWHVEKVVEVKHKSLDNKTGKDGCLFFIVSFSQPCTVRIQNAAPRCHIYVS